MDTEAHCAQGLRLLRILIKRDTRSRRFHKCDKSDVFLGRSKRELQRGATEEVCRDELRRTARGRVPHVSDPLLRDIPLVVLPQEIQRQQLLLRHCELKYSTSASIQDEVTLIKPTAFLPPTVLAVLACVFGIMAYMSNYSYHVPPRVIIGTSHHQ